MCAIVIQTTASVLTAPITPPPHQPHTQRLLTFRGMQTKEHAEWFTFQSEIKQALFLCVCGGRELPLLRTLGSGGGVLTDRRDAPGVWILDATDGCSTVSCFRGFGDVWRFSEMHNCPLIIPLV